MMTFAELKAHLDADLCGAATIAFEPCADPDREPWAVADEFVARHGFRPIGQAWQVLPETTAHEFLAGMLHRSLAYGDEWMERPAAEQLATAFRELFDPHAVTCLSNGKRGSDGNIGWQPLTGSTFDLAVVLHDSRHLGMICVVDED